MMNTFQIVDKRLDCCRIRYVIITDCPVEQIRIRFVETDAYLIELQLNTLDFDKIQKFQTIALHEIRLHLGGADNMPRDMLQAERKVCKHENR